MSHQSKICLIGSNNLLASQLEALGFQVFQYGRSTVPAFDFTQENFKEVVLSTLIPLRFSLYIIGSGFLQSRPIESQALSDIADSFMINAAGPVSAAELILKNDSSARIFLIGSESGFKGSFDMSYALSKCSLSVYVRNRRLSEDQQLLLINPSTIGDLGMTVRRKDVERLNSYMRQHPKKRFLDSQELSKIISNLFASSIYLTNTEININGGKFASLDFD